MTEARYWLKSWKEALAFFSDALSFEPNRKASSKKQALSALFGFALLAATSFFMLWLGDRINAPGMAVTRFLARVQAPLTAELSYPERARGQISVVMYDRQFLEGQGSAWPISYQEHADWIGRLVELPGAKPRALMIDITFGQERNDPTIAALKAKLCEIGRVHRVPVYLAALPDPLDGSLRVRSGLAQGPGEDACFTLVGVDYVPDPLDGLAWSYQLNRFFDGAGWSPGQPPPGSAAPQHPSAALAMAQDAMGVKLDNRPEPMALMWGFKSEAQADRPNLTRGCDRGEPDLQRWVPRLIRQMWERDDKAPLCPYHRSISFAQVAELDEAALSQFVGDKFVFIGARVPGYNDHANSPVHGLIPGVFLHAMALDNFLSYGADYKISAEWTLPPHPDLVLPGLVSVAIVFLVNLGWHLAKDRLQNKDKPVSPGQAPSRFADRIREALRTAAVWVLRICLQSVTAIFLISMLQEVFRIGMLPVVELVGMTLLAEGLGYMSRIRWLISGPEEEKLCQRNKETQPCECKPISP
jgi:CHASE2 domain